MSSASSNAGMRVFPDRYADRMNHWGRGVAQWHPAPIDRVTIGDVGFMKHGRFWHLLRATCTVDELEGCTPLGYTPLQLSPSKIGTVREAPRLLYGHSERVYRADMGASVNTPIAVSPGASIEFELARSEGAGFLSRHETRSTDTPQDGRLESYIKRHHDSWVEFAREEGYGDITPVLVSGIDSAQDWVVFTHASRESQLSTTVTLDVPALASTWAGLSASWSNNPGLVVNWGPSSEVDTGDESDSPQCPSSDISRLISSRQPKGCVTFIRGWRLKKRKLWSPKTIRAAAEPRDLDDNEDFDPESESGQVFISTTPEQSDAFEPIFNYIFQNSDAEAALLHDDDLAHLYEWGQLSLEDDIETILWMYSPKLDIDSSGVATISKPHRQLSSSEFESAEPSTSSQSLSRKTTATWNTASAERTSDLEDLLGSILDSLPSNPYSTLHHDITPVDDSTFSAPTSGRVTPGYNNPEWTLTGRALDVYPPEISTIPCRDWTWYFNKPSFNRKASPEDSSISNPSSRLPKLYGTSKDRPPLDYHIADDQEGLEAASTSKPSSHSCALYTALSNPYPPHGVQQESTHAKLGTLEHSGRYDMRPHSAMLDKRYSKMMQRAEYFLQDTTSISVRIEWPGYPTWKRTVKPTYFAADIADCLDTFVSEATGKTCDVSTWRVGPGFIGVADVKVDTATQVSENSWKAAISLLYSRCASTEDEVSARKKGELAPEGYSGPQVYINIFTRGGVQKSCDSSKI